MARAKDVYTADGSTQSFAVTFPFISRSHVTVTVNGASATFTWVNDGQITISSPTVVNTDKVIIQRASSDTVRLVDYVDGSNLTESDLDLDSKQAFYMSQEALDERDNHLAMDTSGADSWDAQSKKITDLTTPTNANDASNKSYVDAQIDTSTTNADNAAASATASATSATASATSATAAATSETNAATSYDNFDDRYLGQKSSDPSVNNDGDALLTGALYYNTSNSVMMVYSGSAWQRTTPTSSDQTNINSTVSNATNINTVAGSIANVNLTGGSITNVNTVGTNIASVNTCAGDIQDIIDTAADLNEAVSEIETVANDLNEATSEIDTVATNITNVNNVGNNIANVNTVAGVSANVTTVAGVAANVTTCATNNANITTTANNITGVNSFGERYRVSGTAPTTSLDQGDLWFDTANNELKSYGASWQSTAPSAADQANINIVGGELVYEEDLGSIADALTSTSGNNISDVADGMTNINTVAGSIANVNTTGNNIANVNTAATNNSNITTVATNIADVNSFANRYRIGASDPTTSLDQGDLFFNTTTNELKNYSTSWKNTTPSAADQLNIDIVAGELIYQEDLGLVTEALTTTTGNNISDVADDIANVNTVAGISANVTTVAGISSNVTSVANISANVTSVANNEANVNRYADEYTIASSAPGSPSEGDLWYDSTNNVLKYYTGSIFASIAAGISDVVSDTSPALGGNLDCNNRNLTECGTVSGDNLQIDFGSIA